MAYSVSTNDNLKNHTEILSHYSP